MATVASLYQAVYDAPDADDPRLRLAKRLKRRRDPRGEFIELQVAVAHDGTSSATDRKRARSLLKKHSSEWFEPLKGTLLKKGLKWERGFPMQGRLALPSTKFGYDAALTCRPLATLRSLDIDVFPAVLSSEWEKRFLLGASLGGLRELKGIHRALLASVLTSRQPWALQSIEVIAEGGGGAGGKTREMAQLRAIRAAFAKPRGVALTRLYLPFGHGISSKPTNYSWLWRTKAGRALKSLAINEGPHVLPAWHAALTKQASKIRLQRVELRAYATLVLERTDDEWLRLSGDLGKANQQWTKVNLAPALRKLGRRVTDVDIAGFRR